MSKASEWVDPPWLTPNCNDYRCRNRGLCVYDREACNDWLRLQETRPVGEPTP